MAEPIIYVDRLGTDCEKWDNLKEKFGREGLLPLWVADMDFRVPQCVLEAEQAYLKTGILGYYKPPESYSEAFIAWERERHGYQVRREWLRFSPGVVPAINWLVQLFTKPGDAVVVLTPVYYPFLHAVEDNGRALVGCELKESGGRYTVDLIAFEAAIVERDVKLFILCSPHNPVGRVWTRAELTAMLDICKAHGVLVVSDEIHQDFTYGAHRHIPSAAIGDYDHMLVTLTAASKTFNLAGCQNAFVILPDAGLRQAYDGFTRRLSLQSGNPFGYIAVEAAYRGGLPWFEQVKAIIWENYQYCREFLARELPKVSVSPLEGTYLLWAGFGGYLEPAELEPFFQEECGLAVDYGPWFGGSAACHARFNLATRRENLERAMEAVVSGLKAWGRV